MTEDVALGVLRARPADVRAHAVEGGAHLPPVVAVHGEALEEVDASAGDELLAKRAEAGGKEGEGEGF